MEACNVNCTSGYHGYLCLECEENYGKKLTRQCFSCDSEYFDTNIVSSIFKWIVLALLTYLKFYINDENTNSNKYDIVGVMINIFIFYSNIVCISSRFHQDFSVHLENFYEVQRVFSFLETNIYLVHCMFPLKRDYGFYFLLNFYFVLFPLFQLFFILIIHGIVSLKKKNGRIRIIKLCWLLFFQGIISLIFRII